MPEGPEVRRYADQLHKVLSGQPICAIDARTKAAKAWLAQHPSTLLKRRIECVRSHGKNLYARVEGGYFFYSHLMMWGRWEIVPNEGEIARDRRERARIAKSEHNRNRQTVSRRATNHAPRLPRRWCHHFSGGTGKNET
jgi:endonuclease-8